MSDWQINAVHFIDLINGHSHGQKFANPDVIFLPTSSVPMKPALAYAVLMHGSVNNMRHGFTMLVMTPFSLPPEGLPALFTVMMSHSSMRFLSLHVD